jgi:hypothetical protein
MAGRGVGRVRAESRFRLAGFANRVSARRIGQAYWPRASKVKIATIAGRGVEVRA